MDFLRELGIQKDNSGAYNGEWLACKGEWLESHDPATGKVIGRIRQASAEEYEASVAAAHAAFLRFRERGLARTGGSDFHGPRLGSQDPGSTRIPREWWDALLDRIDRRRAATGRAPLPRGG